jgi:acyl-CoA synthetase (NDP forming)
MRRIDIDEIFHPKSIAVVGASSEMGRGATSFFHSLLKIGYEGELYPVNTMEDVALGVKTFPTLLDIPNRVDHVIVGVPAQIVPSIIQDAVKKEVRSVHIFTSGFAELATVEGVALQKKIIDIARGKIRIIGPNCMGIYNPKMKIAFGHNQSPLSGNAGFVSQSGGLAMVFSYNAALERNYCSKVVSLGNSSDLKLTDFLEYFSEDEETETISMYVEGLGNGEGKKLIEILRNTTRKKPVLIWKSGQTDAGARVASSHTGAMSGGYRQWQTIAHQFGIILVDSIEEMHDFIKLHRMVSPPKGIGSCMVTFGGGHSVTYTDICSKGGIDLPELRKETQEALLDFIEPVGTIRRNPVDVSGGGWRPNVIENTLKTVGHDPNVDFLIYVFQLGFAVNMANLFGVEPRKILDHQISALVGAKEKLNIPIVCNNPADFEDLTTEELRLYVKEEMDKNHIPSFPSMERTAKALRRYYEYSRFVNG